MTGCILHQASHTCQLFDLLIRTTGSGIRHHEDVIVLIKSAQKKLGQMIIDFLPCGDYFLIALFICDQSTLVVAGDLVDGFLRLLKQLRLFLRDSHIRDGYRHSCAGGDMISHCLHGIKNLSGSGRTVGVDDLLQNLLQVSLFYHEINFRKKLIARHGTVHISQILRNDLVENQTSQCRLDHLGDLISLSVLPIAADLDD